MKLCLHSRWYAVGQAAYPGIDAYGLRIFDSMGCHWNEINTAPGVYDFTALDRLIAAAEKRGHRILYNLGFTPAWLSARPEEAAPSYPDTPGRFAEPKDLNDWRWWVRTVHNRYRGRIEAYSIWNEPGSYFTGTAEILMAMQRIAREEIPDAVLTTPEYSGWSGMDALGRFLDAGGGSISDVIAHHLYSADYADMKRQLTALRTMMTNHGAANAPLWITETCWGASGDFNPAWRTRKETDLTRSLTWHVQAFKEAGVERMYWLAPDSDWWGFIGFRPVEAHWNSL